MNPGMNCEEKDEKFSAWELIKRLKRKTQWWDSGRQSNSTHQDEKKL
jgi:hypothetical protein